MEGKKEYLVKWEVLAQARVRGLRTRVGGKEEREALWVAVIRSKYSLHEIGWDSHIVAKGSSRCPQKVISEGLPNFTSFSWFGLGNGEGVRSWENCWVGETAFCSLFPPLYRLSIYLNAPITFLCAIHSSYPLS